MFVVDRDDYIARTHLSSFMYNTPNESRGQQDSKCRWILFIDMGQRWS
jgi:hypothetical protein